MSYVRIVNDYIKNSTAYKAFLKNQNSLISADTIDFFPLSALVKAVADKRGGRVFAITPTEDYAKGLFEDLSFVNDTDVIYLPTDGKQLYSEYTSSRQEEERRRAQEEMNEKKKAIVVTSLRAFVSPLLSRESISDMTLSLKCGNEIDPDALSKTLAENGYFRTPQCIECGSYSLRGEVMDIYPFSFDKPIRLYIDWDIIDRISYFDPISQTADKSVRSVSIPLMLEENSTKIKMESMSSFLRPDDYFMILGCEKVDTSWKAMEKEAKGRFNEAYKIDPDVTIPEKYLFRWKEFVSSLTKGFLIYEIMAPDHHHFSIEPSHSYFGNVTFFKDE